MTGHLRPGGLVDTARSVSGHGSVARAASHYYHHNVKHTESNVSDVVSNTSVCALQFARRFSVAEEHLRCLLVLPTTLLELLHHNDTPGRFILKVICKGISQNLWKVVSSC